MPAPFFLVRFLLVCFIVQVLYVVSYIHLPHLAIYACSVMFKLCEHLVVNASLLFAGVLFVCNYIWGVLYPVGVQLCVGHSGTQPERQCCCPSTPCTLNLEGFQESSIQVGLLVCIIFSIGCHLHYHKIHYVFFCPSHVYSCPEELEK